MNELRIGKNPSDPADPDEDSDPSYRTEDSHKKGESESKQKIERKEKKYDAKMSGKPISETEGNGDKGLGMNGRDLVKELIGQTQYSGRTRRIWKKLLTF